MLVRRGDSSVYPSARPCDGVGAMMPPARLFRSRSACQVLRHLAATMRATMSTAPPRTAAAIDRRSDIAQMRELACCGEYQECSNPTTIIALHSCSRRTGP